ncbi:ABC transporter permease [Patulibacter minatonensis]|uniref:ABC transporter permease n=1 Tax=Patulibacter minatonensis TaxID=298163 RepID=UPI0004B063EB|nr:ABC transporter permease [Patulibacter minatonensis]
MSTVSDAGTTGSTRPRRSARAAGVDVLERTGLVLFLIALILWFTIDSTSGDIFTSGANIRQVLSNQSVTGIIALAMVAPLVAGYFDLSVAAIAGMASVTMAALVGTHGYPVWLSIVLTLLVAGIAGGVNGVLVARFKLNAFIVTLGTYTLIGGLLQLYTEGQSIANGIPESFGNWGSLTWLGVPRPFWLLIVAGLVLWYVLTQIPFGRQLESIGSNERGARLVGIRVDRTIFLAFVSSGLLAGVAGVLLTSRAGSADPTAGSAYLFPALAAVFLGATTLRPGKYNVWGTIVGVFVVAVAVNGFTLLGADAWVTPVFNGASLLAAVMISTLFARQRESMARKVLLDGFKREEPADPNTNELER